ncbi:hypothetical protein BKA81DRAFT_38435 [Phyllosticta paracitricarpa]
MTNNLCVSVVVVVVVVAHPCRLLVGMQALGRLGGTCVDGDPDTALVQTPTASTDNCRILPRVGFRPVDLSSSASFAFPLASRHAYCLTIYTALGDAGIPHLDMGSEYLVLHVHHPDKVQVTCHLP